MPRFNWSRFGGYEVSSQGDPRFSAFSARMPDGRSIEQCYQCDVKGYDPGGTNWRLGKGRPPLAAMSSNELFDQYVGLWRPWAQENLPLMRELYVRGRDNNFLLSDRFASTPINQAHALAVILNELSGA